MWGTRLHTFLRGFLEDDGAEARDGLDERVGESGGGFDLLPLGVEFGGPLEVEFGGGAFAVGGKGREHGFAMGVEKGMHGGSFGGVGGGAGGRAGLVAGREALVHLARSEEH